MAKERCIVLRPGKSVQYEMDIANNTFTIKVKEGKEKEIAKYFRVVANLVETLYSS